MLVSTVSFLCSCGGGGESSTSTPAVKPVIVNPPREVTVNLPEKLATNENSTLKIELSFIGSILPSDKFILTANSQLLAAQLNSDRNAITIDSADVTADTDVNIKLTIEGPSNTPSKEITVSITNVSGNLFIQEIKKITDKVSSDYKYTEELHVATMLSLISPTRSRDIEKNNLLIIEFNNNLAIIQNKTKENIEKITNSIKKYQNKEIDENTLRLEYKNNEPSKTKYNLEKISALNKLLVNLLVPIEFPANNDNTESNFIGNGKLGSYIGSNFIFNQNYFYLNSILDKSCIGS